MYPEISQQIQFMPKRTTRNVGTMRTCQPRKFITNFYTVKLHPALKVYVY